MFWKRIPSSWFLSPVCVWITCPPHTHTEFIPFYFPSCFVYSSILPLRLLLIRSCIMILFTRSSLISPSWNVPSFFLLSCPPSYNPRSSSLISLLYLPLSFSFVLSLSFVFLLVICEGENLTPSLCYCWWYIRQALWFVCLCVEANTGSLVLVSCPQSHYPHGSALERFLHLCFICLSFLISSFPFLAAFFQLSPDEGNNENYFHPLFVPQFFASLPLSFSFINV